jgi:hypothetical protein
VGAPIWTDPDMTRATCQIAGPPNVAVCAHPYQADAVYLAFRFGDEELGEPVFRSRSAIAAGLPTLRDIRRSEIVRAKDNMSAYSGA